MEKGNIITLRNPRVVGLWCSRCGLCWDIGEVVVRHNRDEKYCPVCGTEVLPLIISEGEENDGETTIKI